MPKARVTVHRVDRFRGRYAFLRNPYPHLIRGANGLEYPSAEAAFQGGKTLDPYWRSRLIEAAAEGLKALKSLGRKVPLRPDWDRYRHVVMHAVLRAKFADPALAAKLLATGNAELIEGNYWHDNYWGDCHCNRRTCQTVGFNWLGRHLMALRTELRAALPAAA